MLKVTLPSGVVFHEPPYTNQEQREISLRTNGGVVSFSKLSPRPQTSSSPEPAGLQLPEKGPSK